MEPACIHSTQIHKEITIVLQFENGQSLLITQSIHSLFGWLVVDGWCWFVLREEYCWLVAAGCWWLVSCERKVLLAGG
jgi:hypothetical protein